LRYYLASLYKAYFLNPTLSFSNNDFATLNLHPALLKQLSHLGYQQMTPIQRESLPAILQGRDVLAQAKTGSGKTAAFGIGVLSRLNTAQSDVQALIVTPTRELADQVAKALRDLARFESNIKILILCGGAPVKPQRNSLQHGAHIVVGTPGRIEQHLREGSLTCKALSALVLDEADRMLDMGFYEDIDKILTYLPAQRQTLLFSATYNEEVVALGKTLLHDPLSVLLEHETTPSITSYLYGVAGAEKSACLLSLLQHFAPERALVFCNTKIAVRDLAQTLNNAGISARALHGDLEQYERTDVLVQFANRSCVVLVATDLASRGLDIESLEMVVNYELPHDGALYTHRIGRTGRAGASGLALSLLDENLPEYLEGEILTCKPEVSRMRLQAPNLTLVIEGGKKAKLRKGDILGALSKDVGIPANQIGQIDIYEHQSYVAIAREAALQNEKTLKTLRIKGRKFPLWILEGI
jgi:ATP-dependent RNA helicase DbpA